MHRRKFFQELLGSIEFFKIVSRKARLSGEFNSRKDSQPIELEQRSRILVKLFRELCNSKFYGLHTFGKIAISLG